MIRIKVFVSIILNCCCACQMHHTLTTITPEAAPAGQPQILFLQLKVWKAGDAYQAKVETQRQVAGILDRALGGVHPVQGQWLATLLDDRQRILEQVVLTNPLEEQYEGVGEDGQLHSVAVKKDSADCFIRVQYDPRFTAVRVEDITATQKHNLLFTLAL